MITQLFLFFFSLLSVGTAHASDACLDGAYGIYSARIDDRRVEVTEELSRHAIRVLPGRSDTFRRLVVEIEDSEIVQIRELGHDGKWSCYDIVNESDPSADFRWRFGGTCPGYRDTRPFNEGRVLGYYLPLVEEIERSYQMYIESVEAGRPVAATPFRESNAQ